MGKFYYQDKAGNIRVSDTGLPTVEDKTVTEAVISDIQQDQAELFKTINGESIVGEGNIVINTEPTDFIQDLTDHITATLTASDWSDLKVYHYALISSPALSDLDPKYALVNIKLSVNGVEQIIKLTKNAENKYSGLFFIKEGQSLHELTAYYNGEKLIIRHAEVY